MKAILIPNIPDMEQLNKELKDCKKILFNTVVIDGTCNLLIVDNHTRKDKLKKINKMSKKL